MLSHSSPLIAAGSNTSQVSESEFGQKVKQELLSVFICFILERYNYSFLSPPIWRSRRSSFEEA